MSETVTQLDDIVVCGDGSWNGRECSTSKDEDDRDRDRSEDDRNESQGRPTRKEQNSQTAEREVVAWKLYQHYRKGKGKPLTLAQLGLLDKIRLLVKTPNELGKKNGHSLQGDFIEQILKGEKSFKNTYPVGSPFKFDNLWAIGGATIEGTFTGEVRFRGGFKRYFELRGTIRYKFYDKFTDPYDTFNWIKGEWNPDGTAFDIVGEWEETIRIPKLTPEQRKRLQ